MKKFFSLLFCTLLFLSCSNVEKMHHGVKYNPCGKAPLEGDLEVVYGRFNTCGPCCDIVEYPATPIVKTFTKEETEDSPINEEFSIPLKTSIVTFDYSLEFQIVTGDDAKKTFMACKKGKDFDDYIEINLKNNMREVFKTVLFKYDSPEQLIDSTLVFEKEANELLSRKLAEDGITLTRGNIVNRFRFPPKTQAMLDDIQITKTQTMKIEADAKASEIQSKSKISSSEANSKADIIAAEAEAKVILIKAKAEAERIRIINQALSANYLKKLEIENFTYKTELVTPQGVYRISQKDQ